MTYPDSPEDSNVIVEDDKSLQEVELGQSQDIDSNSQTAIFLQHLATYTTTSLRIISVLFEFGDLLNQEVSQRLQLTTDNIWKRHKKDLRDVIDVGLHVKIPVLTNKLEADERSIRRRNARVDSLHNRNSLTINA